MLNLKYYFVQVFPFKMDLSFVLAHELRHCFGCWASHDYHAFIGTVVSQGCYFTYMDGFCQSNMYMSGLVSSEVLLVAEHSRTVSM